MVGYIWLLEIINDKYQNQKATTTLSRFKKKLLNFLTQFTYGFHTLNTQKNPFQSKLSKHIHQMNDSTHVKPVHNSTNMKPVLIR
jgi:hypothetical protein